MRNYWLRIALGALLVFGIGYAVVSGVKLGVTKVVRLKDSADPISIPLALFPFRLEGRDIGTFRGLRVERSTPKDVSRIEFRIALNAGADSLLGADCLLSVRDPQKLERGESFRCYTAADTAGLGEEVIGEVRLVGSDRTLPLLAPKGTLADFRLEFDASGDSASVDIGADSLPAVEPPTPPVPPSP